jgi:hypothetical protein
MGGGVKRLGSLKGIKIGQLAIPGFPFGGLQTGSEEKETRESPLFYSIYSIYKLNEADNATTDCATDILSI